MKGLSTRAQKMGLPMTIEMAKKARELSATGKHVISLSLGEPDFDTPDFIKAAANEAMEQNYTHYMPILDLQMLGPQLQQNSKETTT